MEKNNQPLIIAAMIVGAALIIALAFIFTRDSDDDTATPTTSDTSETQTAGTEEGSEGGQETGTSKCDTQEKVDNNPECRDDGSPVSPVQQITCVGGGPTYILESDGSWIDENGVRRTACEAPTTSTGTLPSDWSSLTAQQKTELNPFDCDHETQWVSAEDGSCLDKPQTNPPKPEGIESGTLAGVEYVLLEAIRSDYWGERLPGDEYGEELYEEALYIALKGNPTDSQTDEFWSVFKDDYFSRTDIVWMNAWIYDYPYDRMNPGPERNVLHGHLEGYAGGYLPPGLDVTYYELQKRFYSSRESCFGDHLPNPLPPGEPCTTLSVIVALPNAPTETEQLLERAKDILDSYPDEVDGKELDIKRISIYAYNGSDDIADYSELPLIIYPPPLG